jgi:hypothetical protein
MLFAASHANLCQHCRELFHKFQFTCSHPAVVQGHHLHAMQGRVKGGHLTNLLGSVIVSAILCSSSVSVGSQIVLMEEVIPEDYRCTMQ